MQQQTAEITQEQIKELEELVHQTTLSDYADMLYKIPHNNLVALAAMVKHARVQGIQRAVYRFHLAQDLKVLSDGLGLALFSEPFIR